MATVAGVTADMRVLPRPHGSPVGLECRFMHRSQRLGGEFLGTFALVLAAVGAGVNNAPPVSSELHLLGAALANGLVLVVVVASFGGISGAHFNPAVTLGMLTVGRIRLPDALLYLLTQLLAATLASVVCRTIYPPAAVAASQLALCQPADWVTLPQLLLTEGVLTFLLMIGIYGTVIDPRGTRFAVGGGFGVGGIVAANILAAGPVTGAAMNPARAFGPALVQNHFDYHLYYWLAPCVGAVVAALVYEYWILDHADRH